jgi:hypothetical protein
LASISPNRLRLSADTSTVSSRKRGLPRAFAEALVGVTTQGQTPLDGFLLLFRATTSATAARVARERIAQVHQVMATASVAGSERAAQFSRSLLM